MPSAGRPLAATEEGTQGRPPARLRVVRRRARPASARSGGRVRCASCGAATTDPWPSVEELERAYVALPARSRGASRGIGDAVLRRTAGSPRRSHRPARARPGRCSTWAPATAPCSTRSAAAGGREGARPGARLASRGRARGGHHRARRAAGRRSSSGTRSSTCRRPAPAIDHAARHLRPGGLLLVAVPNTASLQARVFGDRWFHLDLPRHLVHLPAPALDGAAASARPQRHPGQPLARRPGGVRLAPRPGRCAAGPAGPLRRDPPPRGAQPPDAAAAHAGDRARRGVPSSSRVAALATALEVARGRRHGLRRGAA